MQKILRKRIIRDLKENLFRYLALGVLIILGMYLIVSLVGAAETIIEQTASIAEKIIWKMGNLVCLYRSPHPNWTNWEKRVWT